LRPKSFFSHQDAKAQRTSLTLGGLAALREERNRI
jgi:hypothetical protein